MISVQKAIFPGIAFGCFFLVMITSLIAIPNRSLTVSAQSFLEPTRIPLESRELTSSAPASKDEDAAVSEEQTQEWEHNNDSTPETEDGTIVVPLGEVKPSPERGSAPQEGLSDENEQDEQSDGCSLNGSYPDSIRQWCDLIQRFASEHGVDPNLIAAVMLQESAGNPDAYSKSGAVGLMQVMPRDGLAAGFMCVNGPCFSSRPSMDELFDPEFNINYGVRMLAGLIGRHGNIRDALKAYGPMNYGYRYADIILNIMANHQ